jgi:hypothetical protein
MREESVQAQVVEVTMPPVTEGERSEPGVAGGIAAALTGVNYSVRSTATTLAGFSSRRRRGCGTCGS